MADVENHGNFGRSGLAGPALADREHGERLARIALGIFSVSVFMAGLAHPVFQGLLFLGVGLLLFARMLRMTINAARMKASAEKPKMKSGPGQEDLIEELRSRPCKGKMSSAPCFLLMEHWNGEVGQRMTKSL